MEQGSFQWYPARRTQAGTQAVLPEHEKELLFFESDRAQHRLPRGAVEPPPLGRFKTCLDSFLCKLPQGTCCSTGVGLEDLSI